jgi:peptidyl-prolyl cis-trans isomerase C
MSQSDLGNFRAGGLCMGAGGQDRTTMHRRLLAAAAALALAGTLAASAQEALVARVNGKPISETDMRLAEAEIGSELGALPAATRRRVLLEFLIENQLFADAAVGQVAPAGAVGDARAQYWRRRALRDAYFDRSVRDAVSDADARAYYAQHYGEAGKSSQELRVRHILVKSKAKARELFEKIAHGADFADIARRNSLDAGSKDKGGDLGFLAGGQMPAKFEELAGKLPQGEVAHPFETEQGWHIVRVEDRRERASAAFETVQATIRATIIHHKAQQIAAALRGRAQIEYIDADIRRSVEAERPAGVRRP